MIRAALVNIQAETLYLSVGLIILMGVNIVLGTVNSLFESRFDVAKFLKGIGKAVILILCFSAVYIAGALNNGTLSIAFGGDAPVNIVTAMHAMLLAGYYAYSKKVLLKMGEIIGVPSTSNKGEEQTKPSPAAKALYREADLSAPD